MIYNWIVMMAAQLYNFTKIIELYICNGLLSQCVINKAIFKNREMFSIVESFENKKPPQLQKFKIGF